MKMPEIHPTAIVSPEANLGEGVKIGPYSIVGPDISIGSVLSYIVMLFWMER